jgi:hypothetical protein
MNRVNSSNSGTAMLTWVGIVLVGLLLAGCGAPPAATTPAALPAASPAAPPAASPAAPPAASPAVPPALPASGMARVWFLRLQDPPNASGYAIAPIIYVNRQPFAAIADGTAFFHDFPPGRYRLSVQSFSIYVGQHAVLHLDPGTVTYVQVLGVADWELGSSVGSWTFAVTPMTMAAGKLYLATLSDLGQR